MTTSDIRLEGVFPAQNEVSWQSVLATSLNNIDLQKSLLRKSYDGFGFKGIYHKDNLEKQMKHTGYPGAYPFLRGSDTTGNIADSWKVASSFYESDPIVANKQMCEDSLYGVDYLNLYFDRAGARGIRINNIADVQNLFKGLDFENKELGFHFAEDIILSTNFLAHALDVNDVDNKKIRFHLNCDPYQILSKNGSLPFQLDRVFSHMSEITHLVNNEFPQSRSIGISTSCYHNAGANYSQEIAYALATMVDYIEKVKKSGLKVEQILKQIVFSFSFDSQLFLNIAKIRAFRFLYAKVLEVYKIEARDFKPVIYARSSHRMMSLYDPWGNIMRTTTASFAAALSDVNIIDTFNFDKPLNDRFVANEGYDKELPRRLSRNIAHVLRDESYISKVIDPIGGSWYVESLTYELINSGWEEFLGIEKQSGMGKAISNGFVKKQIEAVTALRRQRAHTRNEKITGVTQFANTQERVFDNWSEKQESSYHITQKDCDVELMKDLVNASRNYKPYGKDKMALCSVLRDVYKRGLTLEKASQILHSQSNPFSVKPLERFRTSEDFEELRLKYEKVEKLPVVNLIIAGETSKLGARVNFCKDVFELVGLETQEFRAYDNIENLPTQKDEMGVYVLITSNEDVDEFIDSFLKLSGKHKSLVYLAGKQKEEAFELYTSKGVHNQLYSGQNTFKLLKNLYDKIEGSK